MSCPHECFDKLSTGNIRLFAINYVPKQALMSLPTCTGHREKILIYFKREGYVLNFTQSSQKLFFQMKIKKMTIFTQLQLPHPWVINCCVHQFHNLFISVGQMPNCPSLNYQLTMVGVSPSARFTDRFLFHWLYAAPTSTTPTGCNTQWVQALCYWRFLPLVGFWGRSLDKGWFRHPPWKKFKSRDQFTLPGTGLPGPRLQSGLGR